MQEELNRLIRNLSSNADELYSRPSTDKMGDVVDAQMLNGFLYLLMGARDHKQDVNEDTLAVIDWVTSLTMRGELGELIAKTI